MTLIFKKGFMIIVNQGNHMGNRGRWARGVIHHDIPQGIFESCNEGRLGIEGATKQWILS